MQSQKKRRQRKVNDSDLHNLEMKMSILASAAEFKMKTRTSGVEAPWIPKNSRTHWKNLSTDCPCIAACVSSANPEHRERNPEAKNAKPGYVSKAKASENKTPTPVKNVQVIDIPIPKVAEPTKSPSQEAIVLSDRENTVPDDELENAALEESDDEFREIAQKAREKARQKKFEQDRKSSTTEGSSTGTPTAGTAGSPISNLPSHQQAIAPDPVVPIVIISRLENTHPLVVKRRLKQRLGLVRTYWCERQGFSKDDTNRVFLTYNGIRLYDVTSCNALGLNVDEDGNILYKGRRKYWGEDEQQIIIEAMTEEILEADRKERESESTDGHMHSSQQNEKDVDFEEISKQAPASTLKVVLKAKGFSDFKLSIKRVCRENLSHT